jgi:hypothetical protein
MSEATAIGHLPDYTSGRRWQRYKVNVPHSSHRLSRYAGFHF